MAVFTKTKLTRDTVALINDYISSLENSCNHILLAFAQSFRFCIHERNSRQTVSIGCEQNQ